MAEQGVRVGGKRARLMRGAGIQRIGKRRAFVVTTRRDQRQRPAPDLVQRSFRAERPDDLYGADMTYVPTWAGFVYLAAVMDVWSRIVGWATGESMTTDLLLRALDMALAQRRPTDVVHHSDQGSQYTSLAFGKRCAEKGSAAANGQRR